MKNNWVGVLLALHAGYKFFPIFKSHFLIIFKLKVPYNINPQNPSESSNFLKSETFQMSMPYISPKFIRLSYFASKPLSQPSMNILSSQCTKSMRGALKCKIEGILLLLSVCIFHTNLKTPQILPFSSSLTHFTRLR